VAGFPWRLVTVDIDGTLTLVHGWREIAAAFGRLPDYESSQRRFVAHEIGEDEHLADLLDLATGHTVAEVQAVVARTPKLAHIADGVGELHRLGARAALLTHNPPYVTQYYRRTYGFDDEEGSAEPPIVDGVIGFPSSVRADKLGGLRALLSRAQLSSSTVVHVGDGWSDAEVFPRVGGGLALNSRFPEVDRAADLSLRTQDFGDVVVALGRMGPRR
jgi:phosphoserine phosphatase